MKRKILSVVLALVLCVSMMTSLCACADTAQGSGASTTATAQNVDPLWESATYLEDVTLGEGETTIEVEVKALDKAITVTINTDAKNLEDALTGVDLVQGDESEYGLYIKVVNGILADFDKDGAYWALSKNGEYLNSGANTTEIKSGEHYELVYTK